MTGTNEAPVDPKFLLPKDYHLPGHYGNRRMRCPVCNYKVPADQFITHWTGCFEKPY